MTNCLPSIRNKLAQLICISLLCLIAHTSLAAPSKQLWERWLIFDPLSTQTIKHSAWQQFLHQYVKPNSAGINLVAYNKVTPKDKQKLNQYIQYLESIHIDAYNRPEQMAYWINLYNAETVRLILQHYPVTSILKVKTSPGFFASGPWDQKVVNVEGIQLSLNDIEHRILRPIWNDPRIHFAVNCASLGCPNLQQEAYRGADINQQLNHAAKQYINSPRGAAVKQGKLTVSKIFEWYKSDFGSTDQTVIDFLSLYADPTLKQKLQHIHHISDTEYDWALNKAT